MHIVIFTGAGISEESGLPTFRGGGGLWHNHRIEDIASIEALEDHPERVIEFYNMRRQNLRAAKPNAAHYALASLETRFRVTTLTQNVDDLHERAGATQVIHLHGELMQARSTLDPNYVIKLGERDIQMGDRCPRGGQLRPDIVLFGESLTRMEEAERIAAEADLFIVIGTSLQVFPAAGLVDVPRHDCPRILIDPAANKLLLASNIRRIAKPACVGVPELVDQLLKIET